MQKQYVYISHLDDRQTSSLYLVGFCMFNLWYSRVLAKDVHLYVEKSAQLRPNFLYLAWWGSARRHQRERTVPLPNAHTTNPTAKYT